VGAAIDVARRRVPNALTVSIAGIGLVLADARVTDVGLGQALGGLTLGLLIMLPGFLIGATGGGDVKLFAALGTMLGPARVGMAFVYTALAGAALALAIAWRRRQLAATLERTAALATGHGAVLRDIEHPSTRNRFAYAPAIAAGALIAVIRG
jgi:prepilin peptidase CpaA